MVIAIAPCTTPSSSHVSRTWWYFSRTTADSGETMLADVCDERLGDDAHADALDAAAGRAGRGADGHRHRRGEHADRAPLRDERARVDGREAGRRVAGGQLVEDLSEERHRVRVDADLRKPERRDEYGEGERDGEAHRLDVAPDLLAVARPDRPVQREVERAGDHDDDADQLVGQRVEPERVVGLRREAARRPRAHEDPQRVEERAHRLLPDAPGRSPKSASVPTPR